MIILGANSDLIKRFFAKNPRYAERATALFSRKPDPEALQMDISAECDTRIFLEYSEITNKLLVCAAPRPEIVKTEFLNYSNLIEFSKFTNGLIHLMNKFICSQLDLFNKPKIFIINSSYTQDWKKGNYLYLNHMSTILNYQRSIELELSQYGVELTNYLCGPINTKFQKTSNGIEFNIDEKISEANFAALEAALIEFIDADL